MASVALFRRDNSGFNQSITSCNFISKIKLIFGMVLVHIGMAHSGEQSSTILTSIVLFKFRADVGDEVQQEFLSQIKIPFLRFDSDGNRQRTHSP